MKLFRVTLRCGSGDHLSVIVAASSMGMARARAIERIPQSQLAEGFTILNTEQIDVQGMDPGDGERVFGTFLS
jgi:hypothetical protein